MESSQTVKSYKVNWKCMPFLGEVSREILTDSCLYITGKNESHIHPLFKINLITYTQKSCSEPFDCGREAEGHCIICIETVRW